MQTEISPSVYVQADKSAQLKIFLIGMMGVGKTYWAQRLKKKLKIATYDLDNLVEIMDERSVAEIFEQDGEEYFRKEEGKMLRLFREKKQYIVSCGGGTPCFNENMQWMNKQGITIWIDEPVDILTKRLLDRQAERPLIKALTEAELSVFLEKKLQERLAFYQKATYRVCGPQINENTLVKLIREHV